jgi:hypothetical protein
MVGYTLLLYFQGKRAPAAEVADELLPHAPGLRRRGHAGSARPMKAGPAAADLRTA